VKEVGEALPPKPKVSLPSTERFEKKEIAFDKSGPFVHSTKEMKVTDSY